MRWGILVVAGALVVAGCSSSSNGTGGMAGEGGAGGMAGEGGAGGMAGEGGGGGMAGEGGTGGGLCPGGCAATEYCAGDTCDAPGTCQVKPVNCVDIYDPVCGCDGNTYGNGCEAELAGVRIDFEDPCPCASNDDCFPGEYCSGPDGQCDVEGECEQTPELCPLVFDPVCGCDGVTYDNDCNAAQAGTRVAADGPC